MPQITGRRIDHYRDDDGNDGDDCDVHAVDNDDDEDVDDGDDDGHLEGLVLLGL